MALEQAWDFLKAAGREHTGSPSRTVAPTGGGSKLYRHRLKELRLRDEKARRTAAKLRVQNNVGTAAAYSARNPPKDGGLMGRRFEPQIEPEAEDWGDKEYQQFFSELATRNRRLSPPENILA